MKSSKRFRVVVYAICGAIVITLLAFTIVAVVAINQPIGPVRPEHPSPMPLAKQYLNAIADGDAAAAHAMDKNSFGASTPGVDNVTFTTGEALRGATERIHDLKFKLGGDFKDDSWVDTTYLLAGKTYKSQLQFSWDTSAKAWHLDYGVATLVSVYSYTTILDQVPLPYTLGGVRAPQLPAGDQQADAVNGLRYSSLVYPAVYPLTVTINPATLANPATPTTTTLLVPPDPYKGGEVKFLLAAPSS